MASATTWSSSTPSANSSDATADFAPPISTPILPPPPPTSIAGAGRQSSSAASSSSITRNGDVASGRCVELALEGERRCRNGDTKTGIVYLEDALAVGTDDLRTLSAIYSQLGNAYFYMNDYIKALEYHRHDLTLARTVGDKVGEAKASGNLGNTLKVLGKFDEAILCCQRHLEISRELEDRIGESRALYNVANVYHAKGKHIGRLSHSEAGEFPMEVRACLQKAAEYYEQNLGIVQELDDRAAEGRACGNLGNTYYLLGDFLNAVQFHKNRLKIAQEFGDKPAMRRAYSNLGNAHVFLGDFEEAIDYYQLALAIAVELRDQATEAQACYSLGNTCTLLGEHSQAIIYHLRHLKIARVLKDRVGQARAAWSLGNAFTSLGEHSKALYFVTVHLQLSREIGDQNGEMVAEQNWSDLVQILGPTPMPDSSSDPEPIDFSEVDVGIRRIRGLDGLLSSFVDDRSSASASNGLDYSKYGDHRDVRSKGNDGDLGASASSSQLRSKLISPDDPDWDDPQSFFELLSRAQSKRMDDQRCDPRALLENKENRPRVRATDGLRASSKENISASRISLTSRSSYAIRSMLARTIEHFSTMKQRRTAKSRRFSKRGDLRRGINENYGGSFISQCDEFSYIGIPARDQGPEEFLEMVAGIQGRRMDDQRAALPCLPGLQHPARVLGPHIQKRRQQQQQQQQVAPGAAAAGQEKSAGDQQLEDDFIEMLIRCQSTRIEEQRSELPLKKTQNSVTVPDDDFFQLLIKMQARRFDEQRADLQTEEGDGLAVDAAANEEEEAPVVADDGVAGAAVDPNQAPLASPENPPHKRTASQKIKKR